MVIARALVKEEPPGKLLAVELCKEILVTDVGQQLDHLLQGVLNGLIAQLLSAALQVHSWSVRLIDTAPLVIGKIVTKSRMTLQRCMAMYYRDRACPMKICLSPGCQCI